MLSVSPHTVAMTVLVKQYVTGVDLEMPTRQELGLFLAAIMQDSELEEPTLELLRNHLQEALEQSEIVIDNLQEQLSAFESPDDLVNHFKDLKELVLADQGEFEYEGGFTVERSSLFGLFIRRSCLTFDKALFEGLSWLFDAMELYRECEPYSSPVSRSQRDAHISQTAKLLESKSVGGAGVSLPSFEKVEATVKTLLSLDPHHPRVHYLTYLNCVRHREFQGAVDALHCYFDYSIVAAANSASKGGGTSSSDCVPAASSMIPYAILSLAGLHAQFGHTSEAMEAIHETVRIAQTNKDMVCLSYALAWMCSLLSNPSAGDPGTSSDTGNLAVDRQSVEGLLARLGTVSASLDIPYLRCLTTVMTAHLKLLHTHASSDGPSATWEAMRAAISDTKVPASAKNADPAASSKHSLLGALMDDTTSSIGEQVYLLHASSWDRFGFPGLAMMYSRMLLSCGKDATLQQQQQQQQQQNAAQQQQQQQQQSDPFAIGSSNPASAANGGGALQATTSSHEALLAHCQMATQWAGLASYGNALRTLVYAAEKMPVECGHEDSWFQTTAKIIQEYALVRGEIGRAEAVCSHLLSLVAGGGVNGNSTDHTGRCEALLLKVRTIISQGRVVDGCDMLQQLLEHYTEKGLVTQAMMCTLMLAEVHQSIGCTVWVVPYALAAAAVSKQCCMLGHTCRASMVLAHAQIQLGSPGRAVRLLYSVMPWLQQHGGPLLHGQMHLLLAKAFLAQCSAAENGCSDSSSKQPTKLMEDAVASLSTAATLMEKMDPHSRWHPYSSSGCTSSNQSTLEEVLYLLARLLHVLGRTEERNKAARRFHVAVERRMSTITDSNVEGDLVSAAAVVSGGQSSAVSAASRGVQSIMTTQGLRKEIAVNE